MTKSCDLKKKNSGNGPGKKESRPETQSGSSGLKESKKEKLKAYIDPG